MSLPIFVPPHVMRRFGSDVTPLNCELQFKPFVYLNWAGNACCRSDGWPDQSPAMTPSARTKDRTKETPRLSAGPSLLSLTSELAVLIGALHGLLALAAARILLLLA